MIRPLQTILGGAVLLALVAGCSGGSHPAAPPTTDPGDPAPAPSPQLPEEPPAQTAAAAFPTYEGTIPEVRDPSSPIAGGAGPFGVYGLRLDAATMQATVEPLVRGTQLAEDFDVDVTSFFRQSPCGDCLRVEGLGMTVDGHVTADLAIRHPFAVPPPGAGRLDLHVFDVQGQIFLQGGLGDPGFTTFDDIDVIRTTGSTGPLQIMRPGFLVNADGYNANLDRVVDDLYDTEANTHPYRLMKVEAPVAGAFDPNTTSGFADLRNPQGYNVFGMGQTAKSQFEFDFGGQDQVNLVFALNARYGVSARGNIRTGPGSRQQPRYFLPEFSRKEPWRVLATVQNNGLISTSTSSNAEVVVEVNDWQHAYGTLRPGFDPLTDPLDSIEASSMVTEILVAAPALIPTPLSSTTPTAGDGSIEAPLTYTFLVPNALLAPAGDHLAAVAVRDELRGSSEGTNGGVRRDGVTFFDLADFSAYTVVVLTVAPGNQPPNCDLQSTPPPGSNVANGGTVSLDASATTDDNDPPASLTYEWDFDYDGVTFTPEPGFTSNMVSGPVFNPTATNDPRTFAVRVTDTDAAPCIDTVDLTVLANQPPTCSLTATPPGGSTVASGTAVQYDASNTTDEKDPVANMTFEWDTNYNGSTFTPTPGYTTPLISVPLTNPGPGNQNRTVAVRVTDADGASCTTQVTHTVTPSAPNQAPTAVITRPGTTPPAGTGIWSTFNPYPGTTDTVPIYINRTSSVDFDGSSSFDPDGTITAWDWDFENIVTNPANFGIGFASDLNMQNPGPRQYLTYGSTYASLRVTDNLGAVGFKRREVVVTPWSPQIIADLGVNNPTAWRYDRHFNSNPISRVANYVIFGGLGDPTGAVNVAARTNASTTGATTWPNSSAAVDDSLNNNIMRFAVDAANGTTPYATYMANNGDLYWKRATTNVGTSMWSSGSTANRVLITTGATFNYQNTTSLDLASWPGAANTAVVGVATTTGIDFWRGDNLLGTIASVTWTRLSGVLFTPAVGTVRHMNVEIDSAGDVHAAWMEDGPGATDSIRYLQFNPAGLGTAYGDQYLATSMTSVNVAGLPQNGTPHLWVDTTGRPLVVWAEDKLVNTGLDIYIKRGTNANVPVFPVTAVKVNHDLTAFGRTDPNDRDQLHPSVAVDGSNRIWVVWEDRRQYSNGIDDYGEIYSRVYDDVFTTLIPDVPANHFDVHHWIGDHSPWIAFDRANPGTTNAVMTWTADYTNTTDNVLSSVGTFQ